MQQYIGTKIIHAEPQAKDYGPPEGYGQDGYRVVYADGYTGWSPKGAFEEAYRPCDALTFGLAVEALKKGLKVARSGWNGKGMWLTLVSPGHYDVGIRTVNGSALQPWIGMKTADDKFVPWLASQTDVLAEDWQIVD